MATITTGGSGNWSSTTPNAPWPGGTLPTAADDVIIAKNHTVTLDTTAAVALTVTLNVGTTGADVGGRLVASAANNSKLIVQRGITCSGASGGSGTYSSYINLDVSSAPTITCEIRLNASNTTGTGFGLSISGNFNLRGAHRKRWTRIDGALTANSSTSCVVDDATGWRVGDRLAFASTSAYNATPRTDLVTIATITPGPGTTATITWTDGAGTGGAVLYDHADNCPVGNFSSNLSIGPNTDGQIGFVGLFTGAANGAAGFNDSVTNVLFRHATGSSTFGSGASLALNANLKCIVAMSHNAFFEWRTSALFLRDVRVQFERDYNAFFSSFQAAVYSGQDVSGTNTIGPDRYGAVIRTSGSNAIGVQSLFAYQHFLGWVISGHTAGSSPALVLNTTSYAQDCEIFAVSIGARLTGGRIRNCALGVAAFPLASNGSDLLQNLGIGGDILDCRLPSTLTFSGIPTAGYPDVRFNIVNRNADPNVQEIYGAASATTPIIQRDTTTASRSNASLLFTLNSSAAISESFQVLAKAGETITLKVLVRKSSSPAYGASTLPSVTVSGLGITPVVATMGAGTAADTWETLTLNATNSGAFDGLLTVTLTAQSATAGAKAWFAGIPYAPFVTRARHYGFLFNETIPTLSANPYTVASEATAAAYTGVTINATTKRVSFGVGTADTLAKVYDYSQAWAVTNIDKEVPWQRAGALLSLTSGWTVVDPAIPGATWGGGTIEWNTPGAITGSFDSTTFRFNTAGTYDLSGGTFAGTINLTNTSGGGVIVIVLPSGITYTNSDPGSITVEVAVESATASITNIVPGSRLQVYNVTTATEMVNTIVAGTSWTASYPNGTGYSTGDVVRVRLAWMDGTDAKLPIEYTTVAASGGWAVLASQPDDTVYNRNAIDGDTCTEFSHDFVNVQVDVNDLDGSTEVQRGYAWFIAGQMTADGIKYFFGGITAEDEVNYRINVDRVNMRIQNIRENSNLTVRGGNMYRSDGTDIFAPGASGSTASLSYGRAYKVIVSGASVLSPEESARLMSTALETTAQAAKNNAALAAALSA